MIESSDLTLTSDLNLLSARFRERGGTDPAIVFDTRIDRPSRHGASPALDRHIKHQALMRAYQGRYVVLPTHGSAKDNIVERLQSHYEPSALAHADAVRRELELELVEPRLPEARAASAGVDCRSYVGRLLPTIRDSEPGAFIAFCEASPHREHHYRNFLIQSSADLLAESSASALGVIGEYGEPQSALFRILIDEFGYGEHGKKHSVLYRNTLRSWGLPDEYNGFWHLLDTVSLELHNTIHYLFQNPRNFFRQIGFLLYAETSYQKSTGDHYRYLRRHHPRVDAAYFGEHAHIDIHHTAMVVDEVVAPMVSRWGDSVGDEIVLGAELTRLAFARADAHLTALGKALDEGARQGKVRFGLDDRAVPDHALATPDLVDPHARTEPLQIGGIGVVTDASLFASLPTGTTGRELA